MISSRPGFSCVLHASPRFTYAAAARIGVAARAPAFQPTSCLALEPENSYWRVAEIDISSDKRGNRTLVLVFFFILRPCRNLHHHHHHHHRSFANRWLPFAAKDTLDLRDKDTHHPTDIKQQFANSSSSDPSHPNSTDLAHQKPHIGAHQAETLREIAHETAQEELRSPRLAQFGGDSDQFYHDEPELHPAEIAANKMDAYRRHEEEALTASQQAARQAAAAHGSDSEDEHIEDGDIDIEDDMMDKISSSPSIEDGTYHSTTAATGISNAPAAAFWPRRVSSLPYSPRGHHPQFRRQRFASAISQHPLFSTLNTARSVTSVTVARSCSDPTSQPSHLLQSLRGEYGHRAPIRIALDTQPQQVYTPPKLAETV